MRLLETFLALAANACLLARLSTGEFLPPNPLKLLDDARSPLNDIVQRAASPSEAMPLVPKSTGRIGRPETSWDSNYCREG